MKNSHNNMEGKRVSQNKPVILEFVGIPAAGKSTLLERIKEKEKDIIINREKIREYIMTDFKNKMLKFKMKLSFDNSRFATILDKVAHTYSDSDYGYYYLLGMYYYTSILHKRYPNQKIIFDEGFVQHLTSLPFLEEIKINKDFKELVKMIHDKYQIKVVYCNVDEAIALKRIRERGREDRYLSITDDRLLMDALRVKKHNIESVLELFKPYKTVNLNDSFISSMIPDENDFLFNQSLS